MVTATVNPEKATQALRGLIEEMFPEQKISRERAVDKALEIMERERERTYSVKKVGEKKTPSRRIYETLNHMKKQGRK